MPTFKCSECGAGYVECSCTCAPCRASRSDVKGKATYTESTCTTCGGSGRFRCEQCGGVGYLYRKGWWKYLKGQSVNDSVPAPWWAEFFFGQSETITCPRCVDRVSRTGKAIFGRGRGYLSCDKCLSGKVRTVCASCRGTGHDPQCGKCRGTGRYQCASCLGSGSLDFTPALARLPIVTNSFNVGDHDYGYEARTYHTLDQNQLDEVISEFVSDHTYPHLRTGPPVASRDGTKISVSISESIVYIFRVSHRDYVLQARLPDGELQDRGDSWERRRHGLKY